jgi:hypothetical protein
MKESCYIMDNRLFQAMINDVKCFQYTNLMLDEDVKNKRRAAPNAGRA